MSFNAPQAHELNPQQHRQLQGRQLPNAPAAQQASHPPQHIAQLQHQQQQGQLAMNGINGTNMTAAGAMPVPTPAGHQAELNYIYSMVEELSRQLADNRRVTEDIVNGLGRVRTRARTHGMGNNEIIDSAAQEINGTPTSPPPGLSTTRPGGTNRTPGQEENLEALISLLSESLEKAKTSRDANANLLSQYANVFALLLKQFHEYKAKHVADVAAWHHSYRSQLDEARRENSRLREQIWEMQAHASRANESLRDFRRRYDEDERRWDRRVEAVAARQELRFWKRVAMPELEDDDTYWSGDDDIIDPAEKERLRELEQRAVQEQMMTDSQAEDSDGGGRSQQHFPFQQMGVMGGIAMQREDTSHQVMPAPPPRPLSAASSTGSTGPS